MAVGVLYVDDEINNLNSFKAAFRRDFNIYTASSAVEGRRILDGNEIGVIITDQRMPVTTGIEFLESVLQTNPDTIRILLTGFSDINAVIDAINRGQVYKYLVKPWQNDELRIHIQNAIEIYNLRKENKELTYKLQIANMELETLSKAFR
ncbi:response regulator [Mucilaginibacter lappiensis]|uniref:DNA-binding NtrC family response regulator n=1 Tax=Mucilaginibacter lappiensis TaxID=354630 RepID=A0A1N7D3I7_9SPHI|nr:response regulator [Mucilaginibacter lappiensis]MBB6111154.1 DNA-binding NtrC family response regulator [Mucilaginibacter lappiensis]MBB6128720.1 DNA-binding NtrC family response regulator [Mucilaginibacter lappiensis]SIR70402.1 Response regulator receiver domain-containing protein [Mucilaginibacter lappiensis]